MVKYILFFITHSTLTLEHCNLTFHSISIQDNSRKFDKLYIYNTHANELSNNEIIYLYKKYNLDRFFNDICIFNYDNNSKKCLGQDFINISSYCMDIYNDNDRILFLKSDCLLSKNYFKTIFNIPSNITNIHFVSPFICAKKDALIMKL